MATTHNMLVDHNVAVPMRDGAELKCNVFRPDTAGKHPVIMTFGPYGKDVPLQQFMTEAWNTLKSHYPEVLEASSCKHLVFERPDPEVWVRDGFVLINVDSRGAGQSPGKLDVNSPTEFRDFYDAIEWAAVQPWSNGKVGLLGISYYAASQWFVASMQPPHLCALLPWQGTYDFYRDRTRLDGIYSSGFLKRWWNQSVLRNQHGNAATNCTSIYTGEKVTGPAALTPEELAANRSNYCEDVLAHPLNDQFYRDRTPDLSKINIPALVVASWGGLGLHLRGTVRGYLGIGSKDKWLRIQAGSYFHTFLQPKNVAMQKRFFEKYLKGVDNGWEKEPRVEIELRAPGDTVKAVKQSTAWPLAETRWTKYHLDAGEKTLSTSKSATSTEARYRALSPGVTFSTPLFEKETAFAGPVKAKLFLSSTMPDTDLFATLCAFGPDGKEMTFLAAPEPRAPVTQGWLRVSQRKTDPARSTEYLPYYPHDERQDLKPGEIYEVDLEIWPISLSLPPGARLTLTIQGKDFERPGETGPMRGVAWFVHDDPTDRPAARFDGEVTLYTGGARESYLLMPEVN